MPKVIPQASKSSAKGKGQPLSSKSKNQADKIVKAKKPLILFKKEEKMGLYILKVLKSIHPTLGITKSSMTTLNSLFLDIYRKVTQQAVEISNHSKVSTTLTLPIWAGEIFFETGTVSYKKGYEFQRKDRTKIGNLYLTLLQFDYCIINSEILLRNII